jgi:hypothetical protein
MVRDFSEFLAWLIVNGLLDEVAAVALFISLIQFAFNVLNARRSRTSS